MQDQRHTATKIIGEDHLKKLDEAGLVIVLRDERDTLLAKLDNLTLKTAFIEAKDDQSDKSKLIDDISRILGVSEANISSKIRQLQQALKPFAALPNKVPPDYTLVINAKVALGEKIDTAVSEQNVKAERRESVYVQPSRSISTGRTIGTVRRVDDINAKKVPNVIIKKIKKTTI